MLDPEPASGGAAEDYFPSGKALRGALNRDQSVKYVVSGWAKSNHLVLGEIKVTDKGNEIAAVLALLRVLELSGCIVTGTWRTNYTACWICVFEKIKAESAPDMPPRTWRHFGGSPSICSNERRPKNAESKENKVGHGGDALFKW